MKSVTVIQLAIVLLGTFLLFTLASTQGAMSFFEAASLVLANLLLLWWTWDKILSKKLIALAMSVIVFKYAIFAVVIYKILSHPDTDKVWFGVGLSTLLLTVLIYAVVLSVNRTVESE